MRPLRMSILATLALTIPASGGIVYSTFGPAQSFSPGGSFIFSGIISSVPNANVYSALAAGFVASDNYQLDRIDIALALYGTVCEPIGGALCGSQWNDAASVGLFADSDGTPGSPIASWTVAGLPTSNFSTPPSPLVISTGPIPLVRGQHYWLAVTPLPGTWDIWNLGSTQSQLLKIDVGTGWNNPGSGPPVLGLLPAFDVVASDVPEPWTIGFFGFGLLGMSAWRTYGSGPTRRSRPSRCAAAQNDTVVD
jgi:hypothetical protein